MSEGRGEMCRTRRSRRDVAMVVMRGSMRITPMGRDRGRARDVLRVQGGSRKGQGGCTEQKIGGL